MSGTFHTRINDFYKRQKIRLRNRKQRIKLSLKKETKGLTLTFAIFCVVDLFGVFPIIALPTALISCGIYGIPLLIFVMIIQIYTAIILGRCWTIAEKLDSKIVRKNRYPYAAIAQLIYGKYMSIFVTILLDLTVFGAGIPNLLVASQNLQLLGHRVSNGNFYFSFCYWLILIGVFMCPIMWLGSPKNMKALAIISVFTCSIVAILIWFCILNDIESMDFQTFYGINLEYPSFENLLNAYGLIAFQFDIHPMLMTIQVDMQNKSKISNAVCFGALITCIMCITTTIIAGYKYGITTTANVLEILPRSNTLYLAIMLVTLQLCLSSAVGTSPLFQHIEAILRVSQKFSLKRCLIRSILLSLAVIIGELVPRFDLVMGIIGGSLTGPLIFILPPLFYTKIKKLEQQYDERLIQEDNSNNDDDDDDEDDDDIDDTLIVNNYGTFPAAIENRHRKTCYYIFKLFYNDCFLPITIITFGLIATIASTYFNIFNINNFKQFWSPCITNISYSFNDL